MKVSKFLGYHYTPPLDRWAFMSPKRRIYYYIALVTHLKSIGHSGFLTLDEKREFIGHLVGYQARGLNVQAALRELVHVSKFDGEIYFNC